MIRPLLRRSFTSLAAPINQTSAAATTARSKTCPKSIPITHIAQVSANDVGRRIRIAGWVKSRRSMKNTVFVDVNDGSAAHNLQVLTAKESSTNPPHSSSTPALGYGASISAIGTVSIAPSGHLELKAEHVDVHGACPLRDGFPFVPKQQHARDYVREHLHLRAHDAITAATFRVRHAASAAFSQHLNDMRFCQIHTPTLTTNDCEGGGEVFTVRPANERLAAGMRKADVPLEQAYFDRSAFLTVSAQLHLEAMCHGLGSVYAFGPIFRAENSRTPQHLAEFYMLEAEQAFVTGIEDVNQTIEQLLKATTRSVLDRAASDVALVTGGKAAVKDVDYSWLERPIPEMTFATAIDILQSHGIRSLRNATTAQSTAGLSKEEELFLVKHHNGPVFVVEWPADSKPFYVRQRGPNMEAVDLLVPFIGELCGGSVREDDYQRLCERLPAGADLKWYTDLRKFGGVSTGGFGIGFERYLQWLLGVVNIRDVIAFPRWPHNCGM